MAEQVKWSLKRRVLMESVGRYEQFVRDFVEERDRAQVSLRLDRFKRLWSELDEVQLQLEESATEESAVVCNYEKRAEYEDLCFRVQTELEATLPVVSNVGEPVARVTKALTGLKLPMISLPEFSGDFMQWLPFRNTYEGLIHDNTEVAKIQKFHYLKAALKGEAAQIIESISLSADNYDLAWDSVVQRYSNEYLLKRRHFAALFATPAILEETAITLHMMVDEFERHKKTLGRLGEPIQHWGGLLEHLLTTKLPMETLREWENFATTADNPDYDSLVEFLRRRMRMLESLMVTQEQSVAIATQRQHPRRAVNARMATFSATTRTNGCVVCKQDHGVAMCSQIQGMNIANRKRLVQTSRLCNNCLKQNHLARECTARGRCRQCGQRHHSLLHVDPLNERPNTSMIPSKTTPPQPSAGVYASGSTTPEVSRTEQVFVAAAGATAHDMVFLQTALVSVMDVFGHPHHVRALLDSASQPNIMTSRCARMLYLRRSTVSISLEGAGGAAIAVRESVSTEVRSRSSDYAARVDFLVMDKMLSNLPSRSVDISKWNIPSGIILADPTFHTPQPIGIIIGVKHYHTLFRSANRLHRGNDYPVMVDSVFGWVVTGAAGSCETSGPSITIAACMVSLEQQLERFWKSEELCMNHSYSKEESHCEDYYKETTTRDATGRYTVRLPKKPDFESMLGSSKESAIAQLERRLERDGKLKERYHQFVNEYIELGHMERTIEKQDQPAHVYYLPHHAVFKESSSTTKLRVVFDGSAKTSTGHSLNDALCTGPVVQDDLLDIILRFRTYLVALIADIAKMCRQVMVHKDDRSFLRVFFRWDSDSLLDTYELATVTYGLSPSSFLATRTLLQLADDEGKVFPLADTAIRSSFYVDDFIGGSSSVEETVKLRNELAELMSKGGFELRKWTSNRLEVLEGLSKDLVGTQSTREFMPHETVKALGIAWEPEADVLCFGALNMSDNSQPTKHSIFSDIARLFDPLGLIAPVVITGKIFIQRLWEVSCGWDEPLAKPMQVRWKQFASQIPLLERYALERYAFLPNAVVELHTFSDASEVAYGACIYARCEDEKGNVSVALLTSKSRVAPLKRLTLPRLELNAAVLGAHLHDRVKKALHIDIVKSFFWSDSSITLQWIASQPNTWKTYVANRVSEIQHFTRGGIWRHIAGSENPADLVSRGMSDPELLESKLWRNGPTWLASPKHTWPTSQPLQSCEVEMEKRLVTATVKTTTSVHPWFERYSSFRKLVRVIAYCRKFIVNLKEKTRTSASNLEGRLIGHFSPELLQKAEIDLARLAQQDAFSVEIAVLKNGKV